MWAQQTQYLYVCICESCMFILKRDYGDRYIIAKYYGNNSIYYINFNCSTKFEILVFYKTILAKRER